MLSWRKKIIDKYIIREILIPFLAGVAIIGVIMLGSILFQLIEIIISKNIPLPSVIKLLSYQLPEIIVQTFPMAILFATISGMGRLNRENEFTALRMGGISLYRLILPLIILGIVVSGLTFFINEEVVPWSNHEASNIIRYSILKESMPTIQEDVFFKGPEGRLFYVKEYDDNNNHLEKIVVYNLPRQKGDYPEIITADTGQVVGNKWQLEEGIIHRYNSNGNLTLEIQFDMMEYILAEDMSNFFGEQRTTSEMSRERLEKEINLFEKSGINVDSLLVDYHLKLAMPLAALIFILIGTPLSLGSRDSRSAGVVFTIVIIFLYYLLLSLARFLGKSSYLSPLIAAWTPNLIFTVFGLVLLIWRESWQRLLTRLPFFVLIIFMALIPVFVQTEDLSAGNNAMTEESVEDKMVLKVDSAEHLHYDAEDRQLELTGEVRGWHEKFHIFSEKIVIRDVDGSTRELAAPREIVLDGGKVSGCDREDPHYYLQARDVTIYPGDHLIARHVVFKELNGKLPLFYWPYLYISLKEDQEKIVPEIGYSNNRGWFIRSTYYYWYKNRLPGQLYLDYYTISGFAGGFKQFFLYEEDLKGSIYYFTQENRTGIPGLFQWKGALEFDDNRGDWQTNTDLDYTYYDNYSLFKGNARLSYNGDRQDLNIGSFFDSKNYYLTDHNDDKELNLDFSYQLDLVNNWKLDFDYNQDYIYNPEDGLKKRWGSKGYLGRRSRELDFKILLERYAPRFSDDDGDEDQVSFYRWPELRLNYYPRGNFNYYLSLGRYYEDSSGLGGYRASGKVKYDNRWSLTDKITLSTTQIVNGSIYNMNIDQAGNFPVNNNLFNSTDQAYMIGSLPYLVSYQSDYELRTNLTRNLTWRNNYSFTGYRGETPFNFDQISFREKVNSRLNYHRGGVHLMLSGGYDIYHLNYLPVSGILRWRVRPEWELAFGGSYYPDTQSLSNFAITSKYDSEKWNIKTVLKYDPEEGLVKRADNRLVYELDKEWYFEFNTGYDYEEGLEKANLLLKKNFHCRQIWFGYDYIKEEFTLEYRINLFPDKGFRVKSSEEVPFDMNIEEILEL